MDGPIRSLHFYQQVKEENMSPKMRLNGIFAGVSLGIMIGFVLSTMMFTMRMDPFVLFETVRDPSALPIKPESICLGNSGRVMHKAVVNEASVNQTAVAYSKSQCPTWKPMQYDQVLLVAFHPEKTAGSSMARFLEIQEAENGGNFEKLYKSVR